MKKYTHIYFSLGILILNVSCAGNFYQAAAQKDTAKALIESARNSLDDLDYTAAITSLRSLGSTDAASYFTCKTEDGYRNCPRELLAGAYAGRCGFTLLPFVSSISSSTGTMFKFLMNSFTTVDVVPDDCYEAQKVMETFSASELTSDQKMFLALLGMAKMGTYLRAVADLDKDTATDASWDACSSSSTAPENLTDVRLNQIISGLGLFLTYSASLGASGGATTGAESINTICTGLGIDCTISNPYSASITAPMRDAFRDLIRSTDYGIYTAGTTFVLNPCP